VGWVTGVWVCVCPSAWPLTSEVNHLESFNSESLRYGSFWGKEAIRPCTAGVRMNANNYHNYNDDARMCKTLLFSATIQIDHDTGPLRTSRALVRLSPAVALNVSPCVSA
jgi:hypothetical protein